MKDFKLTRNRTIVFIGRPYDIGVENGEQAKTEVQISLDSYEKLFKYEAGIIGETGMNWEGLGVCLNALRANVKSNKLPIHLGLREILNATTITEADNVVNNKKIASSANFLIVQHKDGNKKAINIEASPVGEEKKEIYFDDVYHTNHFCSHSLINEIGKKNLNTVESSFIRQNRMKEIITEANKKKTM